MKLRPVVKIHGGSFYKAKDIISQLPENYQNYGFAEPFAGAFSVTLQKEPSVKEYLNEIHPELYLIYTEIRDNCTEFQKEVSEIKYTEENFNKALRHEFRPAVNEYILRNFSRGGLKKNFAWSERLRGGKPGDVNGYETKVQQLPLLSQRIKDIALLNLSFEQFIPIVNDENVILYCDPPFFPNTRSSKKCYDYEMTIEQHENLAYMLNLFSGKVLLSGYDCLEYQRWYKNWNSLIKVMPNHSGQNKKKEKRTENLWKNF